MVQSLDVEAEKLSFASKKAMFRYLHLIIAKYHTQMLPPLSDADLRLLRVFQTIVESGGISRAQPVLNTSQSTISTQLANLEDRLGFKLCNRGRAGFSLTKRGRIVHDELKTLFSAIDDFRLRVSEGASAIEGELRLGLIEATISHPDLRFAEAVKQFRRRSEKSIIDLHIESIINLETMVLDGVLHLALSYCHHKLPSLIYREIFSERHFLYCGSGHPLFDESCSQKLADGIEKAKYVSRSYLEESAMPPHLSLQSAAKTDNIEGMAHLIKSGEYIAFLPDHFAQQWVELGEMRALLPETINHDAAFHLILARGNRLPSVANAFLEDFLNAHRLPIHRPKPI
ncbi:MAG: LysR family transcriptional regulator [Pseudomonadota bacterium]